MKKFALFILLAMLCLALFACGNDSADKKADDLAYNFIGAVLARSESGLKELTHPNHREEIVYGDEFYEQLELYNIDVGDTLDAFIPVGKGSERDESLGGSVTVCKYVAQIDQMPYDVVIYILDNENGYGVIGASFDYCTDEKYY